MSNSNGNNDNNDEFQGPTIEVNGPSSGLEPTTRNSLVLYNSNVIIQVPLQQGQIYSRAHQVAAQAAAAAAQASQVPMTSHLSQGDQEIVRNGNRVSPMKPNIVIRPRRPLPQEGRKAIMMMARATAPSQHQRQKPQPYSVASIMGIEELQRHPGSVARTMALSPGSWGKGVKRRAPMDMDEDDAMSGEMLNITQKLKHGDSSNQDVDVVGGSKEEEEEEEEDGVHDLSKGANKAYPSQSHLLHQLLTNEKLAEAKPKVNPTAAAVVDEDTLPVVQSIHKKFDYKRWCSEAAAKSKLGLVQGPNVATGHASGSSSGAGPVNGPQTAPGPINGPYTAKGSVNEPYTATIPVNGPQTATIPVNGPQAAPESVNGPYSAPGVNGAQAEIRTITSPRITTLPPIEAYIVPGPINGTQNPIGFFGGSQTTAGFTTGSYFGLGQVNGLLNLARPPIGTQFTPGLVSAPYIGAGEVHGATPENPGSGPSIPTGTLRELLSSKLPFQNPYGIVVPVSKGPASSTSTSSAAATGANGRPIIPPEKLQKMLGELVLSPYITESQAVARLKTLGTTQHVQAEIDRFAAIISCGNAFAASRANGLQQQQQQAQQRQDIAASMSAAAKDLIQAKHRESVIKGVPKK